MKIPAESILRQMPGIFGIKEVTDKSYYRFIDLTSAKMIGFSDPEKVVGLSDEDAKCDDVANNSQIFYQHDQQVMNGATLRTLDLHLYKTNDILGILAIKKPLRDENNQIIAVLVQGFPLKTADINNLLGNIPDLFSISKKTPASATYQIQSELNPFQLTAKELECFFYMLRGKSAAEIASILSRSIRTIESHMQNIKYKCNISKKSELFDFAYAHGLVNIIPSALLTKNTNLTRIM